MLMKSENELEYESVATDEKPPAYDHKQAEEKAAEESQNKLGLLGLSEYQVILFFYLLVSVFYHMIAFSLSLFDGSMARAAWDLASAMFYNIGFIALVLEKHKLLKAFSDFYALSFVVNTVPDVCDLINMSPSLCREQALFFNYFSYQRCKNSLRSLRAMGSIELIGVAACKVILLHMLLKVVELYPKKESSPETTSMLKT